MVDISISYLNEFFGVFPVFMLIYFIFDFLGSFFFGKG